MREKKRMKRATKYSCGYDLTAADTYFIESGERIKIATGIKLNLPNDIWGEIKSRSSLAIMGLDVCGGVIDADYHDEIFVIMHNSSSEKKIIAKDTRIAQIVFQKYCIIDFFFADGEKENDGKKEPNVERVGGFGSTGI